jgi:peptide/nickel transport system substrate-binding protein
MTGRGANAVSRRLVLGAGAATLAACGARPAASSVSTLRFGSSSAGDHTYDPRITMTGAEEQVIAQVFDRLLAIDAAGAARPYLAKSWQAAPDGKSITLQLRDDVNFHDGAPFDAHAVQYTFDTIVDPKTGSMGAVDAIGPYAGADVLGPHEIRLNYLTPFPRILSALADNKASIVSPTAAKRLGVSGFGQAPVGSGPFRFVSWRRGVDVELERNPAYHWAPEGLPAAPPSIDKVLHRFIPNAFTRVAALDAGELDVCEMAPPLDLRRMTETGRNQALTGVIMGVPLGFSVNTSRGPFVDRRVRQAFMMAIDRRWIAHNLLFDRVRPAFGPLASSAPEYWRGVEAYYHYDPAAAGQLLDAAGWRAGPDGVRRKNGQPLSIFLPILLEPEMGVVLQAQARKVGFDLRIEQVTSERQQELIFANAYDLLSLRWTLPDAQVLDVPFLSKNVPHIGKFSFNWSRYQSPALDEMLAQAASSPPSERLARYALVQKTIMDEALFLPIHENTYNVVHASRLTGLRLSANGAQTLLAGATFTRPHTA